ncbi:MAG TPA: hypothetical protein VIY48_21955 [Candidatus Paceibacterota bacterium]
MLTRNAFKPFLDFCQFVQEVGSDVADSKGIGGMPEFKKRTLDYLMGLSEDEFLSLAQSAAYFQMQEKHIVGMIVVAGHDRVDAKGMVN